MLDEIIRSYLYVQYNTDKDLQSLVDSYNHFAQTFYDSLKDTPFPVFTGEKIGGDLLTWVVKGIYGVDRPLLVNVKTELRGVYNHLQYNTLPYADFKREVTNEQPTNDDDLFKRILTWNFYRGDGFNFTVAWFKRRIVRFLTGEFGTAGATDAHFSVSVIFEENQIIVRIQRQYRSLSGYGLFGRQLFNQRVYNDITTSSYNVGTYPYARLFQQAFQSGLLHMPFYFKNISINIDTEGR